MTVTADLLAYRAQIDFNRARPEPLYYQIGASIAEALGEQRIPSGLLVPPVHLLADGLHVAPVTARNVVGYLERQRCIRRDGRRRYLARAT
jgi:DNA-binding transcriptional regulator YhcF (GntR family)